MALDPGTRITWHGHACVEVVSERGTRILVDPWFGNPTSTRSADSVDACDVLLVTHGHGDHLGEAVAIAQRTKPAWPTIHEMSLWLDRQLQDGRERVVGFNKGGTVDAGGVKVTMVSAVHSAGNWSDALGVPVYLGDPAGYVVELENGFRFYHAGDTTVFGDMRLIGDLYHPDLAMLPIGGHYTMGPREAALAVELLGVPDVMPIHYGTFPILAGTPDELRSELASRGLGHVAIHAPAPGGMVE